MRWMTAYLCAAWVLSTAPAGAFNRPQKEPEAKLRACPEVGEGYVRIPGSSTCVRVGGFVRVEGAVVSR